MEYGLINFKQAGDERGHLIALEKGCNALFDVKRVFYIFDTAPNIARGAHANRNSQLILICINGSCDIKVKTKNKTEVFHLNNPFEGLYLNKMIWKEMYNFSYNAILIVISDQYFDKEEYIRDYNEFKLIYVNSKNNQEK